MKNYARQFGVVFFGSVVFMSSSSAFAATTRFSTLSFRPVVDDHFFGIRSSDGLNALTGHIGTAFDYSSIPLQSTIGATKYKLIERLAVQHVYAAFGLTDWLELSTSLPVVWHNRFINPDTLAPATTERSMGDLQVELKARLVNSAEHPIGVAFAPFVTAPTGNEAEFVGNDGATGGARFIFDAHMKDRYALSLNVGALARKHFDAYGVDLNHQFLAGFGAAVKLVKNVTVSSEVETSTPFNNFFKAQDSTPLELRAGVKWNVANSGWVLGASGGGGLIYGTGAPRYRALASLGYTFPVRQSEKTAGEKSRHYDHKTELQNKATVHFRFNSAQLTNEAKENLDHFAQTQTSGSVVLQGYCDSFGSTRYNQSLSERRAKAVYHYLLAKGFSQDRMVFEGKGELPQATSAQEQRNNRRVDILARDDE